MENVNELFQQMNTLWTEFTENHERYTDKGVKSAGSKARKAIGELKKLVTEYRKQSVLASKQ
jgi:hypothetical protein